MHAARSVAQAQPAASGVASGVSQAGAEEGVEEGVEERVEEQAEALAGEQARAGRQRLSQAGTVSGTRSRQPELTNAGSLSQAVATRSRPGAACLPD